MLNWKNNNTKCYACDLEQPRAALGYDVRTFKTYCINKYRCSSAHPNAEHEMVELVPAGKMAVAVNEAYPEHLENAMALVIGKTVSTRLTPAQAMHVMKVSEEMGTKSIYETLALIIERDLQQNEVKQELHNTNWIAKKIPVFKPAKKKEEFPEPPAILKPETVEKLIEEAEVKEPTDNDDEWSF